MNTHKIQIVILTRNRPLLLKQTVDSVLKQTYKDFQVIISDNSTNDETQQIISHNFSYVNNLKYIRREPQFQDFFKHANCNISEITSDYFILFHDDDLMLPTFIETLIDTLEKDHTLVAAASNAYNIDVNGNITGKYTSKKGTKVITYTKEMMLLYANNTSLPFPSYMYRTEAIKNLRFDASKGGKYSDSCFILDLVHKGNIMLLFDFYGMQYRRSDFQDSHFMDVKARCKQIKYLAEQSNIKYHSHTITKWRLKEIYTYFYLEKKPIRRIILKLFFKNHLYKLFFKSIVKKIFIKWKLSTLK